MPCKLACGVLLLLWIVSAGTSCGPATLHPYEIAESQRGAPGVKRVGLLPLNLLQNLPPELDETTDRVTSTIRAHLRGCGVEVTSFGLRSSRKTWNRISDAETRREVSEADVQRFTRELRDVRTFDVLVMPSLVYREAYIRPATREVDWDGAQRQLTFVGYTHMHGSVYTMAEVRGKMPAVSLHVRVYDPEGREVFESFGGLDLVHEVNLGTPGRLDLNHRPAPPTMEFRLRRDRLSDRKALRQGVSMAFHPYLVQTTAPAVEPAGGAH